MILTLGVLAVFGAALTAAGMLGILALERHVGFFAPVWDPDGRHVYLLERKTRGFIWGMGWEHFSPPANAYVLDDVVSLQRLDSETGDVEVLETFDGSPVQGRVTQHYRGHIFNGMSVRLVPADGGVEFRAQMNIPRVPSAEQWSLAGVWAPGAPSGAQWQNASGAGMARPEEVLLKRIEVLAIPGKEGFPASVIAVAADGTYRVLKQNRDFAALYPDGVPAEKIAEISQRVRILKARDFREIQARLVEMYRSQGADEGEALLRAYNEMEELGYIPKSPRLVARRVQTLPDDVREFEIPEEYFRVGLFQDIGSALATPEIEVETGTGTYLKYYDDELGPRLRAWREAGNDRFGVRSEGRLYLLEVRRFDR